MKIEKARSISKIKKCNYLGSLFLFFLFFSLLLFLDLFSKLMANWEIVLPGPPFLGPTSKWSASCPTVFLPWFHVSLSLPSAGISPSEVSLLPIQHSPSTYPFISWNLKLYKLKQFCSVPVFTIYQNRQLNTGLKKDVHLFLLFFLFAVFGLKLSLVHALSFTSSSRRDHKSMEVDCVWALLKMSDWTNYQTFLVLKFSH